MHESEAPAEVHQEKDEKWVGYCCLQEQGKWSHDSRRGDGCHASVMKSFSCQDIGVICFKFFHLKLLFVTSRYFIYDYY